MQSISYIYYILDLYTLVKTIEGSERLFSVFRQIIYFKIPRLLELYYYLAPRRGLRGVVFTLCVCLSVCVSPANILVFYLSAIRRDINLKFIQNTYRVYSIH